MTRRFIERGRPKRSRRLGALLAAAAVIATTTALWAGRLGVITLTDGQHLEGDVTEKPDEVVIRTHGVDTVLSRDRISKIDYTSYDERFRDALVALDPADTKGRVALAREAFDRSDYAHAQAALDSALEINPLDRDARQLQSLVSTQLQLESQPKTAATRSADELPTTRPSPAQRRVHGLDDDQINRVRQLELRKDDNVRIQFRNNVRKRYVDSQPGMEYTSFARRQDVDQGMLIIARGTPAMAEDVLIRNDPSSILTFGRKVQSAIIQGCATSNCHGGNGAGDFRLMTGQADPSTTITNFYLLTQYVQHVEADPSNVFSSGTLPMLDRGDAKRSLLYQYSLPRARAKLKHPSVRGWDGLFRNDDDNLARELVEWMEVDLVRLQPDYGFKFTLPAGRGGNATTATTDESPTTRPAEAATPSPSAS